MALQITNPDEYHEFISGSKFAVVIGYLPHEKPDLPYDRLNTLPLTKYAEVDCSQDLGSLFDIKPNEVKFFRDGGYVTSRDYVSEPMIFGTIINELR